MTLIEIPPINPRDLKVLLKIIPEPFFGKGCFFGGLDYSQLNEQLHKLNPKANYSRPQFDEVALENLTAEEVLNAHSASYEIKSSEKPQRWKIPRIDLKKILSFQSNAKIEIDIMGRCIKVRYKEHKPDYLEKLEIELPKDIELNIRQNPSGTED